MYFTYQNGLNLAKNNNYYYYIFYDPNKWHIFSHSVSINSGSPNEGGTEDTIIIGQIFEDLMGQKPKKGRSREKGPAFLKGSTPL